MWSKFHIVLDLFAIFLQPFSHIFKTIRQAIFLRKPSKHLFLETLTRIFYSIEIVRIFLEIKKFFCSPALPLQTSLLLACVPLGIKCKTAAGLPASTANALVIARLKVIGNFFHFSCRFTF